MGPPGSLYTGGYYHGKLVFPKEYPFKAPSIYMLTPNGRFKVTIVRAERVGVWTFTLMLTSPYNDADNFSRDIVTFIFHFVKNTSFTGHFIVCSSPKIYIATVDIMLTNDVMLFARHNPSL